MAKFLIVIEEQLQESGQRITIYQCDAKAREKNCEFNSKTRTNNRKEYVWSMMRPIFTYGTKSKYHLVCDSFLRRRDYYFAANNLYAKIMHVHMWSPFFVDFWVQHLNYHAHVTSLHTWSQITLYVEHAIFNLH